MNSILLFAISCPHLWILSNVGYNNDFIVKNHKNIDRDKFFNRIFAVDEGNTDALSLKVKIDIIYKQSINQIKADLEKLLKYSKDSMRVLLHIIDCICNAKNFDHKIMREVIRYYDGDFAAVAMESRLLKFGNKMLLLADFEEAKYYFDLVLTGRKNCAEAVWGNLLASCEITEEKIITQSDKFIKESPFFNRYLTLVDEKRRDECIALSKMQINSYIKRREKSIELNDLAMMYARGKRMGAKDCFTAIFCVPCLIAISIILGSVHPYLMIVVPIMLFIYIISSMKDFIEKKHKIKRLKSEIKKAKAEIEAAKKLSANN